MINNSQIKQIFKYTPEQLGYGGCKSAWSHDGNLVAICGDNKIIRIMDRQGKPVLEFPSNQTPRIDDLAWDKDNDSLAILTATHVISIWSMGQRKFQDIELASNKDVASYISWSKTHPVLSIGTEKGSLTFFNRKSQRKIPCISKHGKKITHGDWSVEGHLITCSTDKMLTVSNHQGDTPHDSFIVKGEPSNIKWAPGCTETNKYLCCIIASAKVCWFNPMTQVHKFIEFDKSYGKLSCFEWLDDDKLFVCFQTGTCIVVSVDGNSMGQEIHAFKPHQAAIECIQINHEMKKIAIAAQGSIKFFNIGNWVEESSDRIDITKSSGTITQLHWTDDGSIMTITTSGGYFLGFLTVVPQLFSAYK